MAIMGQVDNGDVIAGTLIMVSSGKAEYAVDITRTRRNEADSAGLRSKTGFLSRGIGWPWVNPGVWGRPLAFKNLGLS
jgi:hypothetical protein